MRTRACEPSNASAKPLRHPEEYKVAMSEPRNQARKIGTVVPGILHWGLHDDRIDFRSDAHAIKVAGQTVLIDPLPLVEGALKKLGTIEAICLTGSCHQRSAWRYRKQF